MNLSPFYFVFLWHMTNTEVREGEIMGDLDKMITEEGRSVYDISLESPVLIVFLRHFGCTFCREALSDLSKKQETFKNQQVKLVLVHMSDTLTAQKYFDKYQLKDFFSISDPECQFYKKFGLAKGTTNQLFGLRVWMRGVEAAVIEGHGMGPMMGDGFQMPGVFLIQNGEIRDKFIHQLSSDRPDYGKIIACCSFEPGQD